MRLSRKENLEKEFYKIQDYWSRKAKGKGILTGKDLQKYLQRDRFILPLKETKRGYTNSYDTPSA